MSHKATNWAIQQRGLKPATKIVLWHLCDRHNPDFGCFPTQARLAEDAEMSISALNAHLAKLEELGLIHRIRVHDARTHKRQATRYILGFEENFPQGPTPETGDGKDGKTGAPSAESGDRTISGSSAKPSPDFAESHLRIPETNPVREPLREPVKEEEGAQAREDLPDGFFEDLLRALGLDADGALPGWWQGQSPREHVRRWRNNLGLSERAILEVARETRSTHPAPPDGPKALDRAMERAAQRHAQPPRAKSDKRKPPDKPRMSPDELAAFYAGLVNSDKYLPPSTISNAMRDLILARGLVTPQQLRMRGVR